MVALVTPEAPTGLLTCVSLGKCLIQSGVSLVNYIDFDSPWIGRQEFLDRQPLGGVFSLLLLTWTT